MVRQIEHPEVQDLHEGDTLVHDVHTLDQAPLTVPEEWMRDHGTPADERRRPIRWMRWLGAAAVLAAGAAVALFVTTGGDDTVARPQTVTRPTIRTVDRWELGLNPPVTPVVLRTVDNWELGLNPPTVLVMPQAMAPVLAPEGDWDHLLVNSVAPAAPVVSIEHDWDHLLLVPVSDGSFEVAEANRMGSLNPVSDASFEVAEANRMESLNPVPDASFEVAEANRMESLNPASDGSFEVAEANRMGSLVVPTFAAWDGPVPIGR